MNSTDLWISRTLHPYVSVMSRVSVEANATVVAAILHPAAVAKAQAELDSVVGRARYPTFDDEPSLPYVKAFIKESMRCVAFYLLEHLA